MSNDRAEVALELARTPIGGNDLLIAPHAALDRTLETNNDKEFARVNGLRVENRLRD
jgi:tRNA(fMet)-specific endonuclease VapC